MRKKRQRKTWNGNGQHFRSLLQSNIRAQHPRKWLTAGGTCDGGFRRVRHLKVSESELKQGPFGRHSRQACKLQVWSKGEGIARHIQPVRYLESRLNRRSAGDIVDHWGQV